MKTAETRPILNIPRSRFERVMEAIALFGLVTAFVLMAYYWPMLPDQVPRHFGFFGRPDAWGHRNLMLVLPAISMIVYLGLSILSRYPHRFNYPWPITQENAHRQYRWARQSVLVVKILVVWMFGWIVWGTIQTALGNRNGLGETFLPLALVSIFGVLALYLLRLYRFR